MDPEQQTPGRPGIAVPLVVILVVGALFVGLASGLAVGAVGGWLVGSRTPAPLAANQTAGGWRFEWPGEGATPAPSARPERGTPAPPAEEGAGPLPGWRPFGGAERPYLGVEVPTTRTVGAGTPEPELGAEILTVQPGTAAEEAGLRVGDRIVGLDGQEVASGADLAAAVSRTAVGQEVTLTVVRDGSQIEMQVTMGAHPAILPIDPGQPGFDDLLEQLPEELQDLLRATPRPSVTARPEA
jgi:S1-C subfamily serine protease